MEVIYLLISVSTFAALLFFFLFIKAVKGGQYDDIHTPSIRMLFEDELVDTQKKEKENQTEEKLGNH